MIRNASLFGLLTAVVSACTTSHVTAVASVPNTDYDEYEVWDLVTTSSSGEGAAVNSVCRAEPTPRYVHAPIDFEKDFPIMGSPLVDAEAMYQFVAQHNANFTMDIAQAYHDLGLLYGIRGDVALCQAIIETGWFKFADGTAVTPDQYNYCGLGVTKRGVKGVAFSCPEDGVRAQLQHLYAYACREPLPADEPLLDPRFQLVERGVAPTWMDLSGRWAANARYGLQIRQLYEQLLRSAGL